MQDRLFVPLNKHWYDLFLEGKKKWEIRGLSNRFNMGYEAAMRLKYVKTRQDMHNLLRIMYKRNDVLEDTT